MMTVLQPMTPTESDTHFADEGSRILNSLISDNEMVHLHSAAREGAEITLSANIARTLQTVLEQISKGKSIVVLPLDTELTPSQAAKIVGVSRPFLIHLLESNEIPYRKIGSQRRIRLTDALAYQRERERRFQVMDALVTEGQTLGLYS